MAAPDRLAAALRLNGVFHDPVGLRDVHWQTHRTPAALALFAGIGFLAGMFGLGAGWANVPVLNLVLGAPLKVSVATSGVVLTVVDTSAAWIFLLASIVIAAYLRVLSLLARHNRAFALIAALEIVVLLAAASGLLNSFGGGHS